MNSSGSNLILTLGGLSYGAPGTEQSWCNYVKSLVSPSIPFELLAGNHEDGGEQQNGLIDNFATCLPDKLGVTGIYGKEYYFDYPKLAPLARIIQIGSGLTFTYGNGTYPNGSKWNYTDGPVPTPHYTWLVNAIDGARAKNIPWVIVGMNKNCITSGVMGCETTTDLMNLLFNKKVDLVLQAHEHSYQRSKQLAWGSPDVYTASYVNNDGLRGVYTKGQGPVLVIDGTAGIDLYNLDMSRPTFSYFAAMNNKTFGYMKYNVTPNRIDASFIPTTGTFNDNFSIINVANPLSTRMTGPSSGAAQQTPIMFSASTNGGNQPYSNNWKFGDGSTAIGNPVSHSYSVPASYIAELDTTDSKGQTAQAFLNVGVCVPVVTTIANVLGNQTNSQGGATFAGGGFRPGIPFKRDTAPQCLVKNNATLVEIRNVVMITPPKIEDCALYPNGNFCDTTFNLADPAYVNSSTCPLCYLHRIHIEIDQSWESAGTAWPNPNFTKIGSSLINVQGFVYWDPDHLDAQWHSYSGWELHPLVSWKLAAAPTPLAASFNTDDPNPFVGTVIHLNGSATGGIRPYAYNWTLGDATTSRGNLVSHSFSAPGVYTITLRASDAGGQVTTASQIVTVPEPDFIVSTNQTGIVLTIGQSKNMTITITGLNGLSSNVTLTATIAGANGPTLAWTIRNVTISKITGYASALLALGTTLSTKIGAYTLTITGTATSLSHSTAVMLNVVQPGVGGGRRTGVEL